MKYLFLVKTDLVQSVPFTATAEEIRAVCQRDNLDYELVYTRFLGEEEEVVRKRLHEIHERPIRVIVCGNLESLHFSVNGLFGINGVELGYFPCDGNYDFFSSFPNLTASKLTKIDELLKGQAVDVDLLKINNRNCITVAYLGMDTNLSWFGLQFIRFCRWCSFFRLNQQWFRRWFHFFLLLFDTQPKTIRLCVNGYANYENPYSVVAFANTRKYGTGSLCAPQAKIDDGLVDLVFVHKLSFLGILKMSRIYWKGLIADNEYARHFIQYRHCMNIKAETIEPVFMAMDTVVYLYDRQFHIQTVPAALRLLLPLSLNKEQDSND
ncbi:MAG: hypothetical protein LBK82_12685 [Planctomycetaceae bacterium]|jgi:diacylglycerol kinase family enzyme|nr:hypothetical protein [Planctomycetaceae bacterium]